MPDPPSFTTKRRSIASDGTLSWGDSETSWRDSVAQSDRVSFDTGNPRPFGDVPDDGSIESFERDTLQYYSGALDQYSISTNWSHTGTRSLKTTANTPSPIWSFPSDGLGYYPQRGDTLRYVNVFRNMNADGWQALRFTHVFAALDKDNYYSCTACLNAGGTTGGEPRFRIRKVKNGETVLSDTFKPPNVSEGVEMHIEIEFADTLTATAWTGDWGNSKLPRSEGRGISPLKRFPATV